jgi:hypothetical protein
VDVIGSPGLDRLIGALTAETCDDIPLLDLVTGELQGREPSNQDTLSFCYKIDRVRGEEAERSDESMDEVCFPQGTTGIWPLISAKTANNSPVASPSWIFRLNFAQNKVYPYLSQTKATWIPLDSGLIFSFASSVLVPGHEQLLL